MEESEDMSSSREERVLELDGLDSLRVEIAEEALERERQARIRV